MKPLSNVMFSAALALLATGCARPEAVRLTAKSAVPIAATFRGALPLLEKRLAVQHAALDRDRANQALIAGPQQAMLARARTEMAMGAKAEVRIKTFGVLTADGDAVRADPLAATRVLKPAQIKPTAIPTKDVDRMIAGLTAMAKSRRWSFAEIAAFVDAVDQENARLAAENDADK